MLPTAVLVTSPAEPPKTADPAPRGLSPMTGQSLGKRLTFGKFVITAKEEVMAFPDRIERTVS